MTSPSAPRASLRTPIFNIPFVIVICVGVLALVHVLRLLLSPESDLSVLRDFAYVPARIWLVLDPHALAARLVAPAHDEATLQRAELGQFFVAHGGLKP